MEHALSPKAANGELVGGHLWMVKNVAIVEEEDAAPVVRRDNKSSWTEREIRYGATKVSGILLDEMGSREEANYVEARI